MKILGIDSSSKSTGWALIEDRKLIEYGKINPTDISSYCQKLNLFYVEISKIFERFKPDKIAIEETVFVRNLKSFRVLARIHGVILLAAYQYLKEEPILYEPSKWKKLLDDCNGSAKKYEIQLSVSKIYKLMEITKIQGYLVRAEEIKMGNFNKKEKNKIFDELGIMIYSETGINNDIADAIGIATVLEKELKC